ncbi:MAG: phosphoglycerate kinase [Candidatus Hecatellales archaeon B24]|nr:MAG: phosphoglycerate kinase [Candidatus Hecatellales archaeon B24]
MKQLYLTLEDVNVSGRTVLVRVDINSPIDPDTGKVQSDTRIRLHAKTLKELADHKAKVVVLAHQGRKGDPDFVPLKSHAETLEKVLGRPVKYVDDVAGEKAVKAVKELKPGEILLLENVRFHPDETVNRSSEEHAQSQLVKSLAALADLFVLDGFSVAHRSHASVVGFTHLLPSVAGRVMEAELSVMDKITKEVKKPFLCLLGGSKVEKGSEFVEFLLSKNVDLILTGGLAGNLLLYARGVNLGEANLEVLKRKRLLEHAERMGEVLERNPGKVKVPVDVAVKADDGRRVELKVSELPSEHLICDIGSETISLYVEAVRKAETIFVTGPMGIYEEEAFSKGTFEVFKAIADSNAFSVASGGHTVSALRQFDLAGKFTYTSIAGGAFLEHMMGKRLPGVEGLKAAAERWRKA